MANSIKIWKTVERRIGGPFKFCNSTPLWHNFNFICGNRPFVQPSWSSLGVNTCGDIYDNQGLCSFQTLRTKFCLPASTYFVFLQLRSALKAYGVPWSSPISSYHFKVIHRAYITPYKRFKMKLQSNLNCHICNTTSSGTFLHMFWECTIVIGLWTHVNLVLSSLLRIDRSVNPKFVSS